MTSREIDSKQEKEWIPTRKRKYSGLPGTKVSWHESFIVRTAAVASLIILCGYIASITISINGIQSVSQIAYDPQIEQVLGDHLNGIKEVHELKQSLILLRIKSVIPPNIRTGQTKGVTPDMILKWLELAQFNTHFSLAGINVRPILPIEKLQGKENTSKSQNNFQWKIN